MKGGVKSAFFDNMAESPKVEPVLEEKIHSISQQVVAEAQIIPHVESLDTAQNVASKTTEEQDRKSAAQRDERIAWEDTQRKIAVFVVFITMGISAFVIVISLLLKIFGLVIDSVLVIAAFTFMSSTTSLVVGFYFSSKLQAKRDEEQKFKNGDQELK